jgi:hypothetical protein
MKADLLKHIGIMFAKTLNKKIVLTIIHIIGNNKCST